MEREIFKSAKTYVVIAVITGVFLRLYGLDFQSLWFDEILTVLFSKLNFPEILNPAAIYGYANPHPPLHNIFLHYWIKFFGESEIILRLSSALTGIAAIAVTYLMTKKRLDNPTSACLTIITALSATLIFYSQETRAYIFIYLLSTVLTFWWLDIIKEINETDLKAKLLVKYAIFCIITCYIHYFGAILVFLQLFYLLLTSILAKKYFEDILITFLSISLCFSFWVVHDIGTSLAYGKSSLNWLKASNLYYVEMLLDFIFNKYLLLLLLLPFVLNFLSGNRKEFFDYRTKALLYLVLTPIIGLFIISFVFPVFYARYFIIVLPAVYLLISMGITANKYLAGIKSVLYVFTLSTIALFVFLFIRADNIQDCNLYPTFCNNAYYKPHKQNWRGLARHIAKNYDENSAIFITRDFHLYAYYLSKIKPAVAMDYKLGNIRTGDNLEKIPELSKDIKNLFILSTFSRLTQYELNYINQYYKCVYKEFTGLHMYECKAP